MTDTLHILHGNDPVGALRYVRRRDEITLAYDAAWRFGRLGFPLSLSLPLTMLANLIAERAELCAKAMA